MAKQFRGNQRGWKRGTIHTDEGTSSPPGSFVNGTGDEFFACAGFPGNQNGGVGRSDFGNPGKNGLQRPRCTNNFLEHRSLVDLLAKGNVLLLKFLLGSLALINIRRRNIPTLDLPLVVLQRIVTNQKPAIIPIRAPHSQLQLVSGATGAITIGISERRSFLVIRMNEPTGTKKISGCLPPLFNTKADVIERNAVGKKTFTTGSKYRNLLRCEVQHLPELHFLLPDLFFGALLFAQVEDEHDALVRTLKQRASNQHGHAAAVFPEKLLLVWLKNPNCQCLCQGTFVALAQFGRRQIRPAQSARDEILTAVLQHL